MENNMEKGYIDPKIKKEINEEGFEDNAAVTIGKKEEMPQLLEKLESEGKTVNLRTYLKLHKEISLPIREVKDEQLKKKLLNRTRLIILLAGVDDISNEFQLRYVDKEGNIADTKIKLSDIASYSDTSKKLQAELESNIKYLEKIKTEKATIKKILLEELKEFGFYHYDEQEHDENKLDFFKILEEMNNYKEKLAKKAAKRKKEEFDF